ncbi:MAG: 7-carboxy-7-deazaguanine synthase QueE [Phycisphaerales bacterium]|nr:7-carboxy-7-deazaguanine synthase QueE [Phycisphaerales bacterium]
MNGSLLINEIFHSIQGESTRTGLPCVFIRLKGCHLRCVWCDTSYAFTEGQRISIDEIIEQVSKFPTRLVQVTGGEPLLQADVHELMRRLCDEDWTVLLETSGASDISECDARVIRIMDLKAPSSGECERNLMDNLVLLNPTDEVKIVIGDRNDYQWAKDIISQYDLTTKVAAVLLSPVFPQASDEHISGHEGLDPAELAKWMLEDGLDVRLQTQLHKIIWHPQTRGV